LGVLGHGIDVGVETWSGFAAA